MDLLSLLWLFGLGCVAALAAFIAGWIVARRRKAVPAVVTAHVLAERVRAVGKLVALEVCAKEIATAKHGWDWLPPILLSPARLAMIFHFEKQFSVDLSRLGRGDVREVAPGRFRIILPPLTGALRLTDVSPYDIQSGRILGLLDIIQMTAERQGSLMRSAQEHATTLYRGEDERYMAAARLSAERQLSSLLDLFGVEVEIHWRDGDAEPTDGASRAHHVQPPWSARVHAANERFDALPAN